MNDMNRTMQEAMRLMQAGDLQGATRVIQGGLPAGDAQDFHPAAPQDRQPAAADFIDGEFRIERGGGAQASPDTGTPRPTAPGDRDAGRFTDHIFKGSAGTLGYKLFVPAGIGDKPAPLLLMLHGCTQSPDDFARGTRMNALARTHGYVVAYPAQPKGKNANKCWNWFRSEDQQRGRGEPALIAALARHLVTTHRLDERRVYVAGLSAGGAMAAVLADTYPDIFAAVGVHSGLPCGVARDLPSAMAAMKPQPGMPSTGAARPRRESVPTIVFHGDRDATVDPRNGAAVIAQSIGSPAAATTSDGTTERASEGGRQYTRTLFRNADGLVIAEQWVVHGGGHAWFGGDRTGSHADPTGPDASGHMLRFFGASIRSDGNHS